MSLVLILGAGFSRAISEHVPLTSDLCSEFTRKDQDPRQLELLPPLTDGQDLERWLSVLAEPQPYLDEAQVAGNRQQFLYATRVIRQAIETGQAAAMQGPTPPWLDRLIGYLHQGRHTVISFNYDTLLESATTSLVRTIDGHRTSIPAFHAQRIREERPIYATAQGLMAGTARVPTYSLLKLHGSLDTWWIAGDISGESIGRIPPTAWGAEPDARLWDPEQRPAGKDLFIVPPASAKSAYYANPVSRQLWQDAYQALQAAETVCLVGYSLPLTDLTIANMLASALQASTATIEVVDRAPDAVADNLERLRLAPTRITCTEVSNEQSLLTWVDHLVGDTDITMYPPAD